MKNALLLLLVSLLISGCGATKLVTGSQESSDTFSVLPMFQNPLATELNDDAGIPEKQDVCIGFVSQIYF